MHVDPLVRLQEIRDAPASRRPALAPERDELIRKAAKDNYLEEVAKAAGLSLDELKVIITPV